MPRRRLSMLSHCVRVAAVQYGVISREQAMRCGLSKHALSRLVLAGSWVRLRPSVYAMWTPRDEEQLWRQRLMAARLWLGDRAAVSHRAAGVVSRLEGITTAPLELSIDRFRRATPGLVIHRVRPLEPIDIVWHDGFRITSVPRTIVDLASVLKAAPLELALESALRNGQATIDQIHETLARTPRNHRGRRAIQKLLVDHPGRATGSGLETHAWQLFRGSGLPLPARRHEIFDENGSFVAEVDFAFVDLRIAIEVDGYAYHSSSAALRKDRARQNRIVALGWVIYRTTWTDLKRRGPQVMTEIRSIYQQQQEAITG